MAEAADYHDARIVFASFPMQRFPLTALAAGRVVRQICASGVDVVLLDSIVAAFLGPWLMTHTLDRPLVAIVHQPPGGLDHGRLRTRTQTWLDVAAYRRARRLLVTSDLLAQSLVAVGLPVQRVRVVVPGHDPPVAGGATQDLREGRGAALLTVGNWLPRKDLLAVLDAFAQLPMTTATLHLVGDDTVNLAYTRLVRARLSRPDLTGRVRVHGPLPKERVAMFYRSADVFVLASRREPYGMVYAEAMAAGLPVVGWRAGNVPHLVTHDGEGLVLAPGDVVGLADALDRLARDERYRARLSEGARRRAQSLPTWGQSAERFFTEVREAATG